MKILAVKLYGRKHSAELFLVFLVSIPFQDLITFAEVKNEIGGLVRQFQLLFAVVDGRKVTVLITKTGLDGPTPVASAMRKRVIVLRVVKPFLDLPYGFHPFLHLGFKEFIEVLKMNPKLLFLRLGQQNINGVEVLQLGGEAGARHFIYTIYIFSV
jgi:hypothetical protein